MRNMRVTVMYLASLCLATGTAQASNNIDAEAALAKLVKANHRVHVNLHKSRKRVKMKLHALGARLKTVAEWREKWMKSGKMDRIARYLDGRADNAKLWYLYASKANKRKMAKLGLGHINVGYIDHWKKFNELADTYNKLTECIIKLKMEQMKRDIADMRARIKAMNDSYAEQMECVRKVKMKVKSMHTTVNEMLNTVKTQNLGLELLLAYLNGIERGLSESN